MSGVARMWVVWERQRRSQELSRRLGCETYVFDFTGLLRYPRCIWHTVATLFRRRPRTLFVQNPSMILAAVACLYGLATGTTVIVDRHTTFGLNRPRTLSPKRLVFLALHHFTIRLADLTIVTNEPLAEIVRAAGGIPFVLPDPIPELTPTELPALSSGANVLVISSFGYDEPVGAVLDAARQLTATEVQLFITGNPDKGGTNWRRQAPENVSFTGFIPAQDFVNLLFAVDAVVVLTTADHTMLCGCYEAVAAEKPLVTSDKRVLREYFHGAEFVTSSSESIAAGLTAVLSQQDYYAQQSRAMKKRAGEEWAARFSALQASIVGEVPASPDNLKSGDADEITLDAVSVEH